MAPPSVATETVEAPSLRQAILADGPALALLGAASFLETYAGRLPGPALIAHCRTQHSEAAWERLMRASGSEAWLAEAPGGAPVGYALLTRPDLPGGGDDDRELRRIYVLSRWQGGGTGRGLLERAIAAAEACEAQRLLLGVWAGNLAALRFYARAGFGPIGTRCFMVGDLACDDQVLALPLRDAGPSGQDRRRTGAVR